MALVCKSVHLRFAAKRLQSYFCMVHGGASLLQKKQPGIFREIAGIYPVNVGKTPGSLEKGGCTCLFNEFLSCKAFRVQTSKV